MDNHYDIIIIGGGIAGISAAAELAFEARVLVLEMEDQPGYHATGRSAAYFAPAYGNAIVRGITRYGHSFFRDPPDGFTESPLIHPRGACFIASREQDAHVERLLTEQGELEELTKTEITKRVPILKDTYVERALYDGRGGDIDVNNLLQGYARLLRQRGGVVQSRSKVEGLTRENDNWQVSTASSTFIAPLIVNAAGAWADQLAVLAGLEKIGLSPLRRSVLLAPPPEGLDISDWPLVLDIEENFYFKPDAGQLLISPANETPSEPCDAAPEEMEIAIAVDRFENATNYAIRKINHRWAGLRTFAADKSFVVGFDPRKDGFFWLAGQGGYGVQSAPGMARLSFALITGNSDAEGIESLLQYRNEVSPQRFL